jgi:hypothetical protein
MKLVKLGIISIIVLFGVITAISSFIPSRVRISRAIDITAPRSVLYGQLAEIRQWENWNEYLRSYSDRRYYGDSMVSGHMTISISGKTDSLVVSAWQSPAGTKFDSGLRLISFDSLHHTVQWYFDFRLRWYPWEKFQSIIYDQQFGPVMEKSLQLLKQRAGQFQ